MPRCTRLANEIRSVKLWSVHLVYISHIQRMRRNLLGLMIKRKRMLLWLGINNDGEIK